MSSSLRTLLGEVSAPRDFRSGAMRIHGDVIEFRKSNKDISKVYRISNISSINVFERETPTLLLILTTMAFFASFAVIGIPFFVAGAAALFRYYFTTDKYRLEIIMNAGGDVSTYIADIDVKFLRDAAEAILEAMNGNAAGRLISISVDQRQITETIIHGDVSDSTIVSGNQNQLGAIAAAP